MANPPPPNPSTWPAGYVSKISGDKSEQAGQIIVIDGVEHRADALGVFDPPLPTPTPDDGGMAETSPYGNPYVAPAAPSILERARVAVGGTPAPGLLSPARAALRPGTASALGPEAMGARLALVADAQPGTLRGEEPQKAGLGQGAPSRCVLCRQTAEDRHLAHLQATTVWSKGTPAEVAFGNVAPKGFIGLNWGQAR